MPVLNWLVVALAVVGAVLSGSVLSERARERGWLVVLLGLAPFYRVDVNLLSYEWYRGDTRGLEVSWVDLLALCAFMAVRARRKLGVLLPLTAALYLLCAVGSTVLAPAPAFAWFGAWKVARMLFLALVVSRIASEPRLAPQLLTGLAMGLVGAAGYAVFQRYGQGMMQAGGPFSHQNGLGMAANMVYPCCFALWLRGDGGWLARAAVGAAAISVVLALSRGGLVLFGLAAGIVYLASLGRKLTGGKLLILLVVALGAGAVLIRSFDTIVERFSTAPDSSGEARELFEEAAAMMIHDHPLGVGLNQFSLVLDRHYADPVGIPLVDRSGIVHNIYYLTAAELGYVGLLAFVLLTLAPVLVAAAGAFRSKTVTGDLLLGLGAGLLVTMIQGKLEWSLRTAQLGYLLFMLIGLIYGVRALEQKTP